MAPSVTPVVTVEANDVRNQSGIDEVAGVALGPRLSAREVQVLTLLADGLDTTEVASRLCYSERTVKNVVQDITRRHNLRNRTHAVAYALRRGLI